MKHEKAPFWTTPKGLVALIFIGFVSYFLIIEHREHLFEYLPFIILLACPFMHIFMHGGHGDHGGSEHSHDEHKGDESAHQAYLQGIEDGKQIQKEESIRGDKK